MRHRQLSEGDADETACAFCLGSRVITHYAALQAACRAESRRCRAGCTRAQRQEGNEGDADAAPGAKA